MATIVDRLMLELEQLGFGHPKQISANCSPAEWTELAIRRGEGELASSGALVCLTGARTARSPEDRFIVDEPTTSDSIHWGKVNQKLSIDTFEKLFDRVRGYFHDKDTFVQSGYVCADERHRVNVRVISDEAWHAFFAQNLFRKLDDKEIDGFRPDWNVIVAGGLKLDHRHDGVKSEVAIVLRFDTKTVLIIGTRYAGEIKKSIFSALNAILPERNVFPMHCSANIGQRGDAALFFGLSGTGKTTLSADPERRLIGDDEHGWSEEGIFNLEGGCYAKTIRLSAEGEPQIYAAIRFGSILENVPLLASTREANYDSQQYTENTRAAYPLEFIPGVEPSGCGAHPRNVFFLTCDAFGVLPPISKLSPDQAMQHFLCGYTAKIAGTEVGVKEPSATFSTCFGAPFMPLPPKRYGEMLRDRLQKHGCPVWLINTGWTGGPYGVGKRIDLASTRALLHAALDGKLHEVEYLAAPHFGLMIPTTCPGVETKILNPRNTWSDPEAYDAQALKLLNMFAEELKKY
jgi:phosphoenolpyruvate carboxykinase (ATP)